MAQYKEGVNPLRPYYIPPSYDGVPDLASNASAKNFLNPGGAPPSKSSFGASARDIFSDIEYADYLSDASPSAIESLKGLLDKAIWKYSSVLIAQPFDVAKTVLQVYVAPEDTDGTVVREERDPGYREHAYDDYANSSDDEPNYFTSTAPLSPVSNPRGPRPKKHVTDRSGYIPPSGSDSPHSIRLKNPHALLEVLSQLWTTSGPASVWKATNTTFIYSVLLRTAETFFRSLLAAIIGLPDDIPPAPLGAFPSTDIINSTSPNAALAIAVSASALASLVLSPIDTARTRLILTPVTHAPRSLLRTLKTLPSPYIIPLHLLPITFLSSTIPTFISASTPLFLKSYLNIDPVLNPSSWSLATFASSAIDLSIRFPLETVLRRAQIATWTSPALISQSKTSSSPPRGRTSTREGRPIETIVPVPQTYRGIVGTMWGIVYEEGTKTDPVAIATTKSGQAPKRRKGQGLEGLYRGWRVGMWGLVGVWGTAFMGAMGGTEGIGAGADPVGPGVGGHGKF